MTEYQNPQQDPDVHRRLILTFALTMVVIFGTQQWLARTAPKTPPKPAANQQQTQTPPQAAPAGAQPQPPAPTASQAPAPAPAAAPAAVKPRQAAAEQTFVVDNDLYTITFSNRGGVAKSWVLKKYNDDHGKPLDLVHPFAAAQYGYPLSLWTYDAALRDTLNQALYVSQGLKNGEISFEYANGDMVVRKRFRVDNSYVLKVETEVLRGGVPVQALTAWPAGFGDQTVPVSYAYSHVEYTHGDDIQRLDPSEVSGGATVHPPVYWGGTTDQYFAAIFLPDRPADSSLVSLHQPLQIPRDLNKPDPQKTEKVSVLGAAVGGTGGKTSQRLFVGPKDLDVLRGVDRLTTAENRVAPLEELVDFGFFGFIGKPLFLALKWVHTWVPDWGWAIVVLTTIITLALLPLRISSMKSMLKMQRLQPQIKAIQQRYEKYKFNDPRKQEMYREIQALQKKEGANPLGGCLPMLLQLPFLIAFYTMLSTATELRHAPWLWIRDLASPDPWYIIPVLFVVSMVYMQKLTPQVGLDPVQQKMMNVMLPVMLGVMTWTVAAGLGLYWLWSNVLSIVQQLWMNNTQLGREIRVELEKRAQRKATR